MVHTNGTRPWRAFVAMPFNPDHSWVYEELIRPALETAGYEAQRVDAVLDQTSILSDIVEGIVAADLVVVDLTGRNGNVMYELGIAHALQKPTVMVMTEGAEKPFDVNVYKINMYADGVREGKQFAAKLQEIAERHRYGELRFRNPVTDYAPELAEHLKDYMSSVHGRAVEDEDDVPQILDLQEEFPVIIGRLNNRIGGVTNVIADVGDFMQKATPQIRAVATLPEGIRNKTAYEMFKGVSKKIDEMTEYLDAELPPFKQDVSEVIAYTKRVAQEFADPEIAAQPQAHNYVGRIDTLINSTRGARDGLEGFEGALDGLPRELTKVINQSSKRARKALATWQHTLDDLANGLERNHRNVPRSN